MAQDAPWARSLRYSSLASLDLTPRIPRTPSRVPGHARVVSLFCGSLLGERKLGLFTCKSDKGTEK
jgi:hypothetical protein